MEDAKISLTEIKAVVKKMKKYDGAWATNLLPRLQEERPRANLNTLYTIASGNKKSQEWRMLFFSKANEYYNELIHKFVEKKTEILNS